MFLSWWKTSCFHNNEGASLHKVLMSDTQTLLPDTPTTKPTQPVQTLNYILSFHDFVHISHFFLIAGELPFGSKVLEFVSRRFLIFIPCLWHSFQSPLNKCIVKIERFFGGPMLILFNRRLSKNEAETVKCTGDLIIIKYPKAKQIMLFFFFPEDHCEISSFF